MPTIAELEQTLTDAANNDDMNGITSLVSSLTTEEKQEFDPTVFGYALNAVANHFDPVVAASTATTFMQDVGLYTDAASIGQAFASFSFGQNAEGIDAMALNTPSEIYPSLDPLVLGETLNNLSNIYFSDPVGTLTAVTDFVSHLGLYTAPYGITMAMTEFVQSGLPNGVTAILDNLDPRVYSTLDPLQLGNVLGNLPNGYFSDPAGTVAAVTDFVSKLGLYTDPNVIPMVLQTFEEVGSLDGVNAIINNLDPSVYPSLDPIQLGNIVGNLWSEYSSDPAGTVATLANFLSHLSLYTDPNGIVMGLQFFGQEGALDAVNAIVDNIDPRTYSSFDPLQLGNALSDIFFSASPDLPEFISTLANFLSHLSLYTYPDSIAECLQTCASSGALDAVNAIVDNINPGIYASFDPILLGNALDSISIAQYSDPAGTIATAVNFLTHLSLYVDPFSVILLVEDFALAGLLQGIPAVFDATDPHLFGELVDPNIYFIGEILGDIAAAAVTDPADAIAAAAAFTENLGIYSDPGNIAFAMQTFAQEDVLAGVNDIVDNLAPQLYATFDATQLGAVMTAIAAEATADPAGAVSATADFLSHLSLYTDPNAITSAMQTFAQAGVLGGVNAVLENTDPQVYAHFDPTALGQAMVAIADETSSLDDHAVATTLGLFSQDLLALVPETYIEQSLTALANDHNLSALNQIVDDMSSTQWSGLSATFQADLHSLGITTGSSHDDIYIGTLGANTYMGLGGNDLIDGGPGNDALYGNAGNDIIYGGLGNDTLDGGTGTNVLIGGLGSDTFVMTHGGTDTILDFNKASGGDKLDFRDVLTNYDASHPITDYVHATTSGGSTIISVDADGAGPGAAVEVAKLQGVTGVDVETLFAHGQILI